MTFAASSCLSIAVETIDISALIASMIEESIPLITSETIHIK